MVYARDDLVAESPAWDTGRTAALEPVAAILAVNSIVTRLHRPRQSRRREGVAAQLASRFRKLPRAFVMACWKVPAAACIALWLVAEVAAANTFVEDRREQRDGSLPIFRSVGMLVHSQAGGGGTAFLVSRCHIVTAHHVAIPKEIARATGNIEPVPGKVGHAAEFIIGPHPAIPGRFVARAQATVVEAGNFSSGSFDGMAADWAILRLDECLGKKFGFLKYARPGLDSPIPRGELMTIGFPRSRSRQAGITVETGCKARDHGPAEGLIGVDCAFEAGMSGGPVLERQVDGGWLVVGLIQQSTGGTEKLLPSYSMADRNQVVSVTAFREALDGILRAEGKRVLAKRTR